MTSSSRGEMPPPLDREGTITGGEHKTRAATVDSSLLRRDIIYINQPHRTAIEIQNKNPSISRAGLVRVKG